MGWRVLGAERIEISRLALPAPPRLILRSPPAKLCLALARLCVHDRGAIAPLCIGLDELVLELLGRAAIAGGEVDSEGELGLLSLVVHVDLHWPSLDPPKNTKQPPPFCRGQEIEMSTLLGSPPSIFLAGRPNRNGFSGDPRGGLDK